MELSRVIKKNKEISILDPFGIDQELSRLPEINKNKDINKLISILSIICGKIDLIRQADFNSANAMLRDIGFVISSLRRFDIQVCEENQVIEKALLILGEKIDGIPRETSYHYGISNPENHRIRTFTDYPDEVHLINGVRYFATDLEFVLSNLLEMYTLVEKGQPINNDLSKETIEKLKYSFDRVSNELRAINPFIFSTELRPFFDPILVKDEEWVGPGGGQVPLLIIDNLLFAYDLPKDHIYRVFSEEGVKFLTPELRGVYNSFKSQTPFIQLCINKKSTSSKEFLDKFFNELIKYRQAHFNVAKKALNEKNRGNYETGSAGYRLEMVNQTLLATKEAKRKISLIED